MKIDRTHRSPNFAKGRKGHRIAAIVEHVTEGSALSCVRWFTNPESKVSAHYLVSKDGLVYEFVAAENTAWHAGRILRPTWTLLQGDTNPNLYCLGVEHEGVQSDEWTPKQIAASAALQFQLCKEHKIPIERERFVEHRRIYADKACPGNLDIDRLYDLVLAAAAVDSKPLEPVPGERRWSPGLNQYVYLVDYESDARWKFVTQMQLDSLPMSIAGAVWSKMPVGP